MKSLILFLGVLLALGIVVAVIGLCSGWWSAAVLLAISGCCSAIILWRLRHATGPRNILDVAPESELDLQRLLRRVGQDPRRHERPPQERVIFRNLRTNLEPGSHERHPERKKL